MSRENSFGTVEYMPSYVDPFRLFQWEGKNATARERGKKPPPAPRPLPTWKIETEPHVSMMLKRLFPGIKNQMGTLFVTHTPENARNLAWFMQLYPMRVDPAKLLFEAAAAQKSSVDQLRLVIDGRVPIPAMELKVALWPLQEKAAEAARIRLRMILGDDVGLGKTGSGIALASKPGRLPVVVVTLTFLGEQWALEGFGKFTDGLRIHVVRSGLPYDLRRVGGGRRPVTVGPLPDVVILSYTKLAGWAETLATLGYKTLIFDEVQELRGGEDTAKWQAAHYLSLNIPCCIGLSATPFYNYGDEFWNVAEVVSPGELGLRSEFHSTWCTTNDKGKVVIADPVAFGSYLKGTGLMLRRTRGEANRELPGGTPRRILQRVQANMREIDKVAPTLTELARAIVRGGAEAFQGERMNVAGQFDMKMRQACGLAKAPYVAEFVRLLLESEHRVLLYGWHREVYDVWRESLKEFRPVMYTGSETPAAKRISKQEFMFGFSRVMFISNRAGAGLDGLQQVCRTCVIGELDWSPGVIEQMIGRLGRDGQRDPVTAFFCIADTVADAKMSEAIGDKRQQIDGVRDGTIELLETLQTDGGHIKNMAQAYLESRGYSW